MRKNQLLVLVLILLQSTWMWAGNPVMVIRCGLAFVAEADRGLDVGCGDGFISIQGHCYALTAADGSCPSTPDGITSFTTVDYDLGEGEVVSVCIPDCGDMVCGEFDGCNPDEIVWNFETFSCGCEVPATAVVIDGTSFFRTCGCPSPLVSTSSVITRGIFSLGDDCALPVQNCYNLGLLVNVEPIICDGPSPSDDVIKIIVKPADDRPAFTPFVDAITVDDLVNCNLLNGTQNLLDVVGLFDGGQDLDRAAFVADATGCIEIEFTRDPSLPTEISFLGDMNETIVVPACPRAFDPCSCRPENIVDADGIVEFWYDELTFTGNPNAAISVAANNIAGGFLTASAQAPYATGDAVGTTDANGLLTIPFFRTPGTDTDVSLQDPNSQTASLMSSCTLAVDACLENIIPTMGEWAIIVLGLLLIICAVASLNSVNKRSSLSHVSHKN